MMENSYLNNEQTQTSTQRVIKVSQLVSYLKRKLDSDGNIQQVVVQGEISNYIYHRSGHIYFTLKDEKSRMKCVMFKSYAVNLKTAFKDGDKVLVKANTSLFEASGDLQLYVTAMKLDGQGDLYLQFELLKKKLNEEGLFAQEHKKQLPLFPFKIGLVTGKNTAARSDVLTTLNRRWPVATVYEYPALVQGEGATLTVINALKYLDTLDLDVILLVRGGGSIEDLWAFNDENLARTIYTLKTPIISGVGHEVDITIVDYVCDKRAPTPTGAAEMATPNLLDVQQFLMNYQNNLKIRLNEILLHQKQRLSNMQNSYVLLHPHKLYEQKQMQLDYFVSKLEQIQNNFKIYRQKYQMISQQFHHYLLSHQVTQSQQLIAMKQKIKDLVNLKKQQIQSLYTQRVELLDAYSPLKSLSRGYAIPFKDDSVLRSVKDVQVKDKIKVKLNDGTLDVTVMEVNQNDI